MAGFNFQPPGGAPPGGPTMPFQLLSPELLAQMAQGAFHPPQGGGGGGMQMPGAAPRQPGFNFAGLAPGLGALAGAINQEPDINERTRRSDAEIADWSKYGTPQQPQPGGALGMPDFFKGLASWMPKLGFTPPGGGFTGGGSSGWGG